MTHRISGFLCLALLAWPFPSLASQPSAGLEQELQAVSSARNALDAAKRGFDEKCPSGADSAVCRRSMDGFLVAMDELSREVSALRKRLTNAALIDPEKSRMREPLRALSRSLANDVAIAGREDLLTPRLQSRLKKSFLALGKAKRGLAAALASIYGRGFDQ